MGSVPLCLSLHFPHIPDLLCNFLAPSSPTPAHCPPRWGWGWGSASLKPGADYLRSSVAILEEHNDDSPECKNFLQQARDLLATLLDTHNQ